MPEPQASDRPAASDAAVVSAEGSTHSIAMPVNPYAASMTNVEAMPTAENNPPGLFVFIVVASILCIVALSQSAPGIATLMTILLTPALLRTVWVITARKKRGEIIHAGDRTVLLLSSLAAALTATVAALIAFFIACVAFCFAAVSTSSLGQMSGLLSVAIPIIAVITFGGTLTAIWWGKR